MGIILGAEAKKADLLVSKTNYSVHSTDFGFVTDDAAVFC